MILQNVVHTKDSFDVWIYLTFKGEMKTVFDQALFAALFLFTISKSIRKNLFTREFFRNPIE